VRSITLLFISRGTAVQILGENCAQSCLDEIDSAALQPHRDVAPAKCRARPRHAVPSATPPGALRCPRPRPPRLRVSRDGHARQSAVGIHAAVLRVPMRARAGPCRPWPRRPAAVRVAARGCPPVPPDSKEENFAYKGPVAPPLAHDRLPARRLVCHSPPWPPPLNSTFPSIPSPANTLNALPSIHSTLLARVSPRLAPPLAGRQATAAAARVRRHGPSPVFPPPRPSEGIEPRGPVDCSSPAPGRTQPPVHRNSAGAPPAGARGPHCKVPSLSEGLSANRGYCCKDLKLLGGLCNTLILLKIWLY
jgi:hypothetical protein